MTQESRHALVALLLLLLLLLRVRFSFLLRQQKTEAGELQSIILCLMEKPIFAQLAHVGFKQLERETLELAGASSSKLGLARVGSFQFAVFS